MMTKDEALKMAIEALISMDYLGKEKSDSIYYRDERFGDDDQLADVISACKQALKQPAQEPVGGIVMKDKNGYPMAAFNTTDLEIGDFLYPHPHQWQGLTDDEIKAIHNKHIQDDNVFEFARAIEQALKEKNT